MAGLIALALVGGVLVVVVAAVELFGLAVRQDVRDRTGRR